MAWAVEVDELIVTYGRRTAVAGASWRAPTASVTAVLGPNGAGKTSTMACIEGLRRPTGGHVRVLGVDPWRADARHRARVGVMLQSGGLPMSADSRAVLGLLSRMYADPYDVDSLMERFGLADTMGVAVRRLSGGQRQRVAVAAALIGRPEVLVVDEPSAGLDPHGRRELWAALREEAERGCALVVTTHSFEEAEHLADALVVLRSGRVLAQGTLDEVRDGATLEERYFALMDAA